MQTAATVHHGSVLDQYCKSSSLEDLLKLPADLLKEEIPRSPYLSIHKIDRMQEAEAGARIIARAFNSSRLSGKKPRLKITATSFADLREGMEQHFKAQFDFTVGEWLKISYFLDKISDLATLLQTLDPKKNLQLYFAFNTTPSSVLHYDGPEDRETTAIIWAPIGSTTLFTDQDNIVLQHFDVLSNSCNVIIRDNSGMESIKNNQFAVHRWGGNGTPHQGPDLEFSNELRALVNLTTYD